MQELPTSGRLIPELENKEPYFNLALEEAILESMVGSPVDIILRFWRNSRAVVVGRGQEIKEEVDEEFCKVNDIQIGRRISGGGAVFHDEGNLNVSFFFSKKLLPKGSSVKDINKFFTGLLLESLKAAGILGLRMEGTSNILWKDKKISGSAGYQKTNYALHHVTLLLDADLDMLEGCLVAKERYPSSTRASKYWPTTNLPAFNLDEWKATLSTLLHESLGVSLEVSSISRGEEKLARILSERMYSTRAWIHDKKRLKIKKLLNELGFEALS